MLRKKLKTFKLRKASLKKDKECNTFLTYGTAQEDQAVIRPAGGKVQAEMYGLRLNYILNMNYYGELDIAENDGICFESDEPDYKVISVRKYPKFCLIELEKLK